MSEYKDVFNPYFLSKTRTMRSDTGFEPTSALPKDTAVTMAYIPFQEDMTTYEPSAALEKGTLFETLDKPFYGKQMMRK